MLATDYAGKFYLFYFIYFLSGSLAYIPLSDQIGQYPTTSPYGNTYAITSLMGISDNNTLNDPTWALVNLLFKYNILRF